MTLWTPRPAGPEDMEMLGTLWHAGWHDAHARIVAPDLVAMRRLEVFSRRLTEVGDRMRIAGPVGQPLGLCIIEDDMIDQLFVAPEARGTGLAAALLHDGEDRLRDNGVSRALLDCAAQNHRAARFYAREGWHSLGLQMVAAVAVEQPVQIEVIRFEKHLRLMDAAPARG